MTKSRPDLSTSSSNWDMDRAQVVLYQGNCMDDGKRKASTIPVHFRDLRPFTHDKCDNFDAMWRMQDVKWRSRCILGSSMF